MIELTKLNKEKFYMNSEQIEIIEQMPDTLITMTNGKKYYAQESIKEVIEKINEYKKTLYANCVFVRKNKIKLANYNKQNKK